MRICVDIDGVICNLKKKNELYIDLQPVDGAIKKLQELKKNGHYIILFTARNMKTQNANIGRVVQNIGLQTLQWLEKHQVPYDEIYFGKPWADIYIDDNAFRFNTWNEIDNCGSNLPVSNEKKIRGDE